MLTLSRDLRRSSFHSDAPIRNASLRGYLTKYDCSSGQFWLFVPFVLDRVLTKCAGPRTCSGHQPYWRDKQDRPKAFHRVGAREVSASHPLEVRSPTSLIVGTRIRTFDYAASSPPFPRPSWSLLQKRTYRPMRCDWFSHRVLLWVTHVNCLGAHITSEGRHGDDV